MDIRDLRAFVTVARLGSFRRAATALHLAQPSVSHQIQGLEKELGARLFERSVRPVALTEPGRAFLPRAIQVLDLVEQGKAEVSDLTSSALGSVAVGATQFLIYLQMPNLLESFRRDHPGSSLQFRGGHSGEVRQMIIDGSVDIGIFFQTIGYTPAALETHRLRAERFVVIVPPNSALAAQDTVSWGDLRNTDFIRFTAGSSLDPILERVTQSAGFPLRAPFTSTETGTVLSMVAHGLGAALVPETLASAEAGRVASVAVDDENLDAVLVLGWKSGAYRSRATEEFARRAIATFSVGGADG